MNFVRAKRILTGLPDDRKNFFSFTGAARQKNIPSGCAFQIPDQLRLLSPEESLRELCAFAPLREPKPREAIFSQRRKGAKFARIPPGISARLEQLQKLGHEWTHIFTNVCLPFFRLFDYAEWSAGAELFYHLYAVSPEIAR